MNGRRRFLGQAGLTAAATLATVALAAPFRGARIAAAALPKGAAVPVPAPLSASPLTPVDAGWHVDDMWGPRYAEPVPYQHRVQIPDLTALAPPADRNFLPV